MIAKKSKELKKEISILCDAILDPKIWHNRFDDDPIDHCNFCYKTGSWGWTDESRNKPIKHKEDCPVTIAKKLKNL